MKKEIKQEVKPVKQSRTIETIKTIVIAILITAVVAFIAGMRYAESEQAKVDAAVKAVEKVVVTESKSKQ